MSWMSGDITSRNDTAQDNEILLGLIAYNSYRVTKLESVVLAWFLQGRFVDCFPISVHKK